MRSLASVARLLVLCVLALLGARAQAFAQEVDELAKRITKEKDSVDPAVFEELGRKADRAAYRALVQGLKVLREEQSLERACAALAACAQRPELEPLALETLVETSQSKRDAGRVRAATRALIALDGKALEPLRELAASHADSSVRTLACDALVPWLAESGDEAALATLLANASLATTTGCAYLTPPSRKRPDPALAHKEVVRRALAACTSELATGLYAAKLADAKCPRGWRLLLIDLLAERLGGAADSALVSCLADADAALVLRALEVLETRGGWEGHERELRALLHHSEPSVRRQAVLALGRMLVSDPAWLAEVARLLEDPDPALRMGAAAAYGQRRTPEVAPGLHRLLADGEWSVRAEALQQVAQLRQKGSIPVLIRSLERERGRMRQDVAVVLRMLTGLDLGEAPLRWDEWWRKEGDTFELPAREAALAREAERQKKAAEGRTSAAFYGLAVQSERVAFVLDVSGSMLNKAGVKDPVPAAPGEATRLDIAKKEISDALRALSDDALFNIVFFESEVSSLDKHLLRMNKSNRARALRFVQDQYALGATAVYPALQLVFSDPLVDTIYLLSDGAPTVGEITDIGEIRAEVARWNAARHVKIHGVTIAQDSDLLRWLADDTGGSYRRMD